jgi:hypothetical protein
MQQAKIDYIRGTSIHLVAQAILQSECAIHKNYRKLLSLSKKSLRAIIYLPNKYYGIGLPKVSDLAQKFK